MVVIIFFTDHQHLAWLALRLLRLDHRSSADSLVGWLALPLSGHTEQLSSTPTPVVNQPFSSPVILLIIDIFLISTPLVLYNTFSYFTDVEGKPFTNKYCLKSQLFNGRTSVFCSW